MEICDLTFLHIIYLVVNSQTETRLVIKPVLITVNAVKLKIVGEKREEKWTLPILKPIEVKLIGIHLNHFDLLQSPIILVQIPHNERLEQTDFVVKGKELSFLIDLFENDQLVMEWRGEDALELDLIIHLELVEELDLKVEVVVDDHILHGHHVAGEILNLLGQVPVYLI